MRTMMLFLAVVFLFTGALAEMLFVPGQYETVQAGIDAASDSGDVLVVLPGEYRENIDFDGKALTIYGIGGPQLTILNGGGEGPCVRFSSGEGTSSIIAGFTFTNGSGQGGLGGAVYVRSAMPIIAMNTIVENNAENGGGAIYATLGVPTLIKNLFLRNNSDGQGGAIKLEASAAIMLNNTFVGNETREEGAALYAASGIGIQFINNIVAHNNSRRGAAVCASRLFAQVTARYNDVWENEGGNYSNVQQGEGAISEDPLFINEEEDNYYLEEDSPCIDTGDPNSLNDFDGSRADIGCYSSSQQPDLIPVMVDPDSLDFGRVEINRDSTFTVRLINPNEDQGEITILLYLSPISVFSVEDTIVTIESQEECDLDITFSPESAEEYADELMIISSTLVQFGDTLTIPLPIGAKSLALSGTGIPAGVISNGDHKPNDFELIRCNPNPFNSSVEILVTLSRSDEIAIDIFDELGRLVKKLYRGSAFSGRSSYNWTPLTTSTGTYYIRLTHSEGTTEIPLRYLK